MGWPARQGIPRAARSAPGRPARPALRSGAHDATVSAGSLCTAWAEKLGLRAGIPIAIGAFDVHYGAIGSGIKEGVLVKAIGTSTCDCGVVDASRKIADIPGICGIVKGAILPGFYGIEAGQSAVGDIFKWWVEVVCEGRRRGSPQAGGGGRRRHNRGRAVSWRSTGTTATVRSWSIRSSPAFWSARRSTRPAPRSIARLIEATAFGARAIIERIKEYGVPVDERRLLRRHRGEE